MEKAPKYALFQKDDFRQLYPVSSEFIPVGVKMGVKKLRFASVAQSAERVLGKDEVSSSILLGSSTFYPLKPSKIVRVVVKWQQLFRGRNNGSYFIKLA